LPVDASIGFIMSGVVRSSTSRALPHDRPGAFSGSRLSRSSGRAMRTWTRSSPSTVRLLKTVPSASPLSVVFSRGAGAVASGAVTDVDRGDAGAGAGGAGRDATEVAERDVAAVAGRDAPATTASRTST